MEAMDLRALLARSRLVRQEPGLPAWGTGTVAIA